MKTSDLHARAGRGAGSHGIDGVGSSGGTRLRGRYQVPVRGRRARRGRVLACLQSHISELSVGCSSILSKAAWVAKECAGGHPALLPRRQNRRHCRLHAAASWRGQRPVQGGAGVHRLPRRRSVTPAASVAGLRREASNRSDLRAKRALRRQNPAASRRWMPHSASRQWRRRRPILKGRTMIASGGTPSLRTLGLISSVALMIIANAPVRAQTAEEQERSYRREAMEQALQTKERFDLYGLHFDSDKATIQPESKSLLDDIATALKNFPDWRLRIVGHTDSTGDPEHNLHLSLDRALAIKAALVDRGVDLQRLGASGLGESSANCQQRHTRRARSQPQGRTRQGHGLGRSEEDAQGDVRLPRLRRKPCRSDSTPFSKSSRRPIRNWALQPRELQRSSDRTRFASTRSGGFADVRDPL